MIAYYRYVYSIFLSFAKINEGILHERVLDYED